MNKIITRIVLVFLLCNRISMSQLIFDTTKRVNYIAMPVLFKTPETGWAFGLSGTASFKTSFKKDSLTRTSTINALGIFSQKEQNIQGFDATIYFPNETHILYAQIVHSYFPDKFWGIGSLTKNSNEEKYTFEQFNITPHLKRKFGKHLFFGILGDYQNILKLKYNSGNIFDTSFFTGKKPYQILGLGLSASYDTRNSTFWPTKGMFLQCQFTTHTKNIFSDFNFNKLIIETRFFKSVFKNQIVAFQFYNYSTFGNTPYRSLASMGGVNNLRGFYQGRYKDKCMTTLIGEYRAYLFWKLSATVFVGVGNVYSHLDEITKSNLTCSYGCGLRLSILEKEKLHLRLDYGYFDKYNNGIYFTVGECF